MTVKTPPRVRRAERPWKDHTQDLRWLAAHQHEYRGQWLFLDTGQLLAYGVDPVPLLKEVRARGYDDPLVIHVPEDDDESFWSGITGVN